MMKNFFPILLFTIGFAGCGNSSTIDPNSRSIQDAHNAYFQMDHNTAYSIFKNVFTDTSKPLKDRTESGRYKAKMEWLFLQDFEKAQSTLDSVLATGLEPSKAHLLKARMLFKGEDVESAIAETLKAIEHAESASQKYEAKFRYYQYLLSRYCSAIDKTGGLSKKEMDTFRQEYDEMILFSSPNSGDVDLAKLRMGYAIIMRNGAELFRSWMSYFRLTGIDQIHPSLIKHPDSFKASLLQYDSIAQDGQVRPIVLALAESGFYEYATLLIKYHGVFLDLDDPRVKEIDAYNQFLQDIHQHTEKLYQGIVKGDFDKSGYEASFFQEAEELWSDLDWNGSVPKFSRDDFEKEISERFKAVVKMTRANGFYGLHMGRVILDDQRTITQYNQSAEFRYIALDHMVSNGYSAWFWDGIAQTGGWATDDESFLQVRSAYTSGPVKAYRLLTDSILLNQRLTDIERLRSTDDSIATKNPISFLPGLSARIDYQQKKSLFDSLRSTGLTDSDLRLHFINSIEELKLKSSIYAHEGRHSIDKKNGVKARGRKLEYTAKLSEIYFTEKPFYSLGSILSRNIGDNSDHGHANHKVLKGIVDWMEKNKEVIEDFSENQPTLPQLDKLSDLQLKAAVSSLDPLSSN